MSKPTEENHSERSWPALLAGEELVASRGERMWRQIHPRFFQHGIFAEDAFVASESEDRKLSTSRETKVTAEVAFNHHTKTLGLQSVGVAALTVAEVEACGSRVVDDSAIQTTEPPTPGHCYIDFRTLSKAERAEVREALSEAATERGLVYKR